MSNDPSQVINEERCQKRCIDSYQDGIIDGKREQYYTHIRRYKYLLRIWILAGIGLFAVIQWAFN